MSGTGITLLLIVAFVALILGSFIWFVVTWDASKEDPVVQTAPAHWNEERRT